MRPYKTIRFIDSPDKVDLAADGRSRDGDRPVFRSAKAKAAVRRHLKRKDRARQAAL